MVTLQVDNIEISKSSDDTNKVRDAEDVPEQFSPAEASILQKIIRKGLVESKNDIEVQRKDPNSPLYSVKSFEALHLLVFDFSLLLILIYLISIYTSSTSLEKIVQY